MPSIPWTDCGGGVYTNVGGKCDACAAESYEHDGSYGPEHLLIVHSVQTDDSPLHFDEVDYEIVHPGTLLGCRFEAVPIYGGKAYDECYDCGVGYAERDGDIVFSLEYSGTRITKPGVYKIRAWASKTYYFDMGYEYDGGVAVVD